MVTDEPWKGVDEGPQKGGGLTLSEENNGERWCQRRDLFKVCLSRVELCYDYTLCMTNDAIPAETGRIRSLSAVRRSDQSIGIHGEGNNVPSRNTLAPAYWDRYEGVGQADQGCHRDVVWSLSDSALSES